MRISRQIFPVKRMVDQKRLENLESFKYLVSMLTNDVRCTCEIKSKIAMAEGAVNKKRALLTSKVDLELRKKLVKMLHLEHSFIWCWNLDASGSRSETPGEVLKCGAGEEWRSVGLIMLEINKYYLEFSSRGIFCLK
jgi:hypothetical protein